MTRKLTTGETYDFAALEFTGLWTRGDKIVEADGYNTGDYFDRDGRYLGPDSYGIEPLFADE